MLFKSNVARINLMQHVAIYSIAKFNRIFASYLKNQWIFALNSRVIISSHNTNPVSRRALRTQWGSTSSCRNIGRCFSPFDSTGAGPPSKTWASSWRRHWWSGTGRIRPAPPQRSGPPPPYRTPWTQTTSPTEHQNSDSALPTKQTPNELPNCTKYPIITCPSCDTSSEVNFWCWFVIGCSKGFG